MSTSVQPKLTFGLIAPYTNNVFQGNWINDTRWQGSYDVNHYTGEGTHRLIVSGAIDAGGMPFPDDQHFTFQVSTAGTLSTGAEPGYGSVRLTWAPSDLPTAAGYNVYRATVSGGPNTRLNPVLLTGTIYTDTAVTNGTPYYYQVRLMTTDLFESNYGNEVSATPNDFTAPTIPVVVDDGTCTNSSIALHARWSASDPESGIAEYQYGIGTFPGYVDVIGWTSTGAGGEVTRTGLNLLDGVTYYFAAKAKNGVGTWGSVGNSDGITVDGGCVMPTPTPTSTQLPTSTSIPSDTPTPTPTSTSIPSSTPTLTPTSTPTPSSTSTPISTSTPTASVTPTLTPTSTPTPIQYFDANADKYADPPTGTAVPTIVQTPTPTATETLLLTPDDRTPNETLCLSAVSSEIEAPSS